MQIAQKLSLYAFFEFVSGLSKFECDHVQSEFKV